MSAALSDSKGSTPLVQIDRSVLASELEIEDVLVPDLQSYFTRVTNPVFFAMTGVVGAGVRV